LNQRNLLMRNVICLLACLLLITQVRAQQPDKPFRTPNPDYTGQFLRSFINMEEESTFSGLPFLSPTDSIGFTGSTSICQGSSLLLTANYAGSGSTYQWQVSTNGGTTFTNIPGATNAAYIATTTGLYTVIVVTNGVTTVYPALAVNVLQFPVAGFSFTPNNQCSSTPVVFTNNSTGNGSLTYTWFFGDNSGSNSTSNAINPSHVFIGTPGVGTQTFTVKLVASNGGCTDTSTSIVTTSQVPGTELGGTGYTLYNGLPYFTQCASTISSFTFTNQSSTPITNTSYEIIWGDNTPNFTATNFAATTHSYSIGTFQLKFVVTGTNGCRDTGNYFVFVGNNPAVGLNNPGNTFICSGTSLTFPISGTSSNPPGTTYTFSINDGSSSVSVPHPAPASFTHLFSLGSCGINSGTFVNSFQATIQASNPCGASAASVVPIYVSQKGIALFSILPKDTVCTSTVVTFTNVSANSFGVSSSGTCSPGKGVWSITPATGWTVSSGSLGNDFGTSDPSLWLNGSVGLSVIFNTPGTYFIKLRTGGTALCGTDSIVQKICVNPIPLASFTLSGNEGCAPYAVTTTNTSNAAFCGNNTYTWSVGYSNAGSCSPNSSSFIYTNNTNPTSVNPQFLFSNPGVYTITLVSKSPGGMCTSAIFSRAVTVKAKPNVTLSAPLTICQNSSISPTSTVNNCYATSAATYQWSFPNGTPSSSTSNVPGAIIYNTAGTFTITLEVTNECGTTTITQNIVVKPVPDVTLPVNEAYCPGSAVPLHTLTSTFTGVTYAWTNSAPSIGLAASGTGNIPAFTAINNGTVAVTGIITVTPTLNGCPGPSQTFSIRVNPKPPLPSVTTPVIYCQGQTAVALQATTATGAIPLWYTVATGGTGTSTAPIPSTTAAGTTTWFVSQLDTATGCESNRATQLVTVKPTPVIGGFTSNNPTACNTATGSITLTGLSASTSYSVSYIKNGSPVTITISSNAGGSLTINSLSSGSYSNITVTLNGCPSNVVGPVSLSDPNPPGTPVAGSNSPVCAGSVLSLNASSSTPGVSYTWNGPNSYTSTTQNPSISNVTTAASGTYTVTATLNGCTSVAGTVDVVVNPRPVKPTVIRQV
jgi:PKD repeat protein